MLVDILINDCRIVYYEVKKRAQIHLKLISNSDKDIFFDLHWFFLFNFDASNSQLK